MTDAFEFIRKRPFPLPLTGAFFFLFFFSFPTIKALSNVLLLVLVIIWIRGWFDTETRRRYFEVIRHSVTVWLLFALSLVILLHVWGSAGEPEWIEKHIRKYARFLYAAILILLLYKNPAWQRYALWGLISAMVFTLVSTWLNLWFILPWSATRETGWGHSHHVFGDYITQNLMMAFFVSFTVARVFEVKSFRLKLLWFMFLVLAVFSITHLSLGRTGQIALATALILSFIILCPRKFLLPGGLLTLVFLIVLITSSDAMMLRWFQVLSEIRSWQDNRLTSIGHRLYNYQTTLLLISERPWLGHGTGAYHTEICRFITDMECEPFNAHPHNQFLFIWADHGVFGLFIFIGLILSLYFLSFRAENKETKVLLTTLTTTLVLNSLINSTFWNSIQSQYFSFLIGLLVSMAMPRSNK